MNQPDSRPDIQPDLIVGHSGFVSTLYLRELYDCPIINYFEYFYRTRQSELDFRKDLPQCGEMDRLRARTRNAMLLLDLENCDQGYSPTHWQRDRLPKEFQEKVRVIFDGVDTAGTKQTHDVQGPPALAQRCAELDQGGQREEFPALNALRDSDQVLGYHPAGAEVQMANLAVTHLTFRKADGEATRFEQGARKGLPQAMPNGSAGQLDRVSVPGLAIPPAVQYQQDHRCRGRRSV